jgi:hypothetical protein
MDSRRIGMRLVAVVCNVLLLGIGCIVLSGDGPPRGAEDITFVTWSVATHLLSASVIWRAAVRNGWLNFHVDRNALTVTGKPGDRSRSSRNVEIVTVVANVVLFGLVCWHLADQYGHPDEPGVLVIATLLVLTPILSVGALFATTTAAMPQRTVAG